MEQQKIDEIKARCDKATVGEWHVSGDIKHIVFADDGALDKPSSAVAICDRIGSLDKPTIKQVQHNADFIAHSREDIPELIEQHEADKVEIKQLTTENAKLQEKQTAKETGIIRRIDDLGRVTITKQLRRDFDIHGDDPLEFLTMGDYLIIRKYKPMEE